MKVGAIAIHGLLIDCTHIYLHPAKDVVVGTLLTSNRLRLLVAPPRTSSTTLELAES